MNNELRVVGGHLVVVLDGARLLVDTGSPVSFGLGRDITLGTRRFTIPAVASLGGQRLDQAAIRPLVGDEVDGLLGMDILGQHCWRFSVREGLVAVSEVPPVAGGLVVPLDLRVGYPRFPASDEAVGRGQALLDTGAHLSYQVHPADEGVVAHRIARDYHPFQGWFETPVRQGTLVLESGTPGREPRNEVRIDAEWGQLPQRFREQMQSIDVDWVLGFELFRQHDVVLDFPGRRMCVG